MITTTVRAVWAGTLVLATCFAAPLGAQTRQAPLPARSTTPSVSLRPFVLASEQAFSAANTFKTVFGESYEPFFGGGLDVAWRNGLYLDITASRFSKTGSRVDIYNGTVFSLSIPVTVTEIPLEFTVGYRFGASPRPGRQPSRILPYLGAGIGTYGYQETTPVDSSGDGVDTHHVGYLAVAGMEFRLGRWVGLTGDVQYTHVPGILGASPSGVSQGFNENDLGGVAGRFRVVIGR